MNSNTLSYRDTITGQCRYSRKGPTSERGGRVSSVGVADADLATTPDQLSAVGYPVQAVEIGQQFLAGCGAEPPPGGQQELALDPGSGRRILGRAERVLLHQAHRATAVGDQ